MQQTGKKIGLAIVMFALAALMTNSAPGDDWPQWRGPERDGVWRETGVLQEFPAERLRPRWSIEVGAGYSGPTVSRGRVFLTDRIADEKAQYERILCVDERSGQKLWEHKYSCRYNRIGYRAGPRACVTVDEGRAYALGAMGHLHCMDVGGAVLWKVDLDKQYQISASGRMPHWGITSAPLVVDDLVIIQVGVKKACLVAFDKKSGEERWRALSDRASYSAPIMLEQAGRPVLVCLTGDSVAGLNPQTGQVYWRSPFAPKNMPIGVATPVRQDDRLFVTSFYDGSLMLRLKDEKPAVERLWRRVGRTERQTDALHCMISTPVIDGKHLYGVDSYGELRCLKVANGDRVWEDQTATPRARWSNIHIVKNGERYWMFNEVGELIICRLSPEGFHEISRTKLIEPTTPQLARRGGRQGVTWAHPAYANRHVLIRNDQKLISVSLESR